MPYRRLPKTDAARLKALRTLFDNNDLYTVRNRFIDWKDLNKARPYYDKLFTACEQYKVCMSAQTRYSKKMARLQRNVTIYISHFLQVLMMCVERGEMKKQTLKLYGMEPDTSTVPRLVSYDSLIEWGRKAIDGEKTRLKSGGRPIYNPTVGMLATHYDIFVEAYNAQQKMKERTANALNEVKRLRPDIDELLLSMWNQVEKHFESLPPEQRFEECRKFGVVYYYRNKEEHKY